MKQKCKGVQQRKRKKAQEERNKTMGIAVVGIY
jgi:hypothetical protein